MELAKVEKRQTVYKLSSVNVSIVCLLYTDQVDEYSVPPHKSALSILVFPHPASCWHRHKMLNVKQTLKGLISDSSDPSGSLFYECLLLIGCPIGEFVGTPWLMAVCPRLTCSSWTRHVSQFTDGGSGEQTTSSSGNIECIRPRIFNPHVWMWNDIVSVLQFDLLCSLFVQTAEWNRSFHGVGPFQWFVQLSES